MQRRRFFKHLAAGAGGLAVADLAASMSCAVGKKGRPNILWLIAEDFCPELGCYGTPLVRTPNIDRLAADGARFTSAFTTSPVCSPSRSAFMTGMYQTGINAHHHRSNRDQPLPEGVRLITEYFREAGYFVGNCGGGNWGRPGKTDWNFAVEDPFDGTDWRERGPGQSFFVQINFSETHRVFTRDPDNPIDPDKIELPPYYPDHPLARRDWADYLECAQVLDKKVGAVLRRLDEDGLTENTMVFFFGDHGRAHVRGKQFLYDGGIHVPLIVRRPGLIKPGTVNDNLVSAVDFGPTCLNLAGIEPPDHMQGRPLLGPDVRKREYIVAARDRCDETYDRIRAVRDRRFKYSRKYYPDRPYTQVNQYKKFQYPVLTLLTVLHQRGELTPAQELFMRPNRPAEELYDLRTDPHEIDNLAGNPAHGQILQQMRLRLDRWIQETGDMGETPEDPSITAYWTQYQKDRYGKRMIERGLSPDISPRDYLRWWEKQLSAR
jgi:uncharacterized sulfatase